MVLENKLVRITLYSGVGTIIKEWDTISELYFSDGNCRFRDARDKEVIVSGTYVIEEV